MDARFLLAPVTGETLRYLDEFVMPTIVLANTLWISSMLAAGNDPPCCVECAAPPWVTSPVLYVPHHGAPVGIARDYQDGPRMFASLKATCADIVGYDVARARSKGHRAWWKVERLDEQGAHATLVVDSVESDPAMALAQRTLELRGARVDDARAYNLGRAPCRACGGS